LKCESYAAVKNIAGPGIGEYAASVQDMFKTHGKNSDFVPKIKEAYY